MKRFPFATSLLTIAIGCPLLPAHAWAQLDQVAAEVAADAAHRPEDGLDPGGSEEATIEEDESNEPIVDSAAGEKAVPENKRFIRFHMWDGAIVGGEVQNDELTVRTEFGSLQIPIDRIHSFYPGLDSFPERDAQIAGLVKDLGDRNYDVREQAHRKLSSMGLVLRKQIASFDDGGSAERKKHLADLRKELDETLEDMDDDGESADNAKDRPLIRGDTVNTPNFSVVGKIEQPAFQIASKYGDLTIRLQDIRFADRDVPQQRTEIRKTVSVPGSTFFQKEAKSSRIRVNKGDRITVRGSGMVNWTNWNNTASPEGLGNQGNWNGMNCGALAARIGKNGSPIKIGMKHSFIAKNSGVLYFAIAMRDNYAQNDSYRWDGEFKARIVVKPAQK